MAVIESDSSGLSELSDIDELSYESDIEPESIVLGKQAQYDDVSSLSNQIDELESDGEDSIDELDDQYSDLTPIKAKPQVNHFKSKGKLINFDSFYIPKGYKDGIDKFISHRTEDGVDQLLCKYKNMSYNSAEWIPFKDLDHDKNIKMRARRFMDKFTWESNWSEDEPFNPSYLKVDRVIDEGELDGVLHYLVKWCSLAYDQSTWEIHTLIEELDADKIDDFNRYRVLTDARRKSYLSKGRYAPQYKWNQLKESPDFKDEYSLRGYQLEGLNWLMFCWYNRQNSILADEMGLGKTIQSTAFLYQLFRQENMKGPFLVVVPLSTMGNWEREMRSWTEMNVVVYHGNQNSRNLLVETEFHFRDEKGDFIPGIYKFDVLLTTYEMAMSGAAQLRPIKWRVAVLDEAHRLKNKTSKVTEFLNSYEMEHRVLLTGTPLQNSLEELWALLNFLEPQNFADEKEFNLLYGNMSSAADVEKLQVLLKPLMLRRLKEDVEKSIPIKEETIVEVELTTTQKKWYRSILEKNFAWLKQGGKKNVPNLVNTMIELRKCCIHPYLLKGAEEQILGELNAEYSDEKQQKALIQSSGKMVLIDKLLRKLKVDGHKVLIFSQWTKCLDLIQEYIRSMKWNYERIDGSVRGELRQASIDRFSAPGSESFIFLLCTRAGGVGINLTAADTCIIFDSDWNPQNDLQAQSRCHRIGQKKLVKIYRLITRNTYEREMFDRASMKLGLDKALLQKMDTKASGGPLGSDPKFKSSASQGLSKDEVEDLLKKGAYGAFMDDGAGDKFCEEDIDQILERRTMVIRHDDGDSESRKGSMFSKATFGSSNSSANVDVNDPNFWEKVREQANLDVVEEVFEDSLILNTMRERKQANRFEGGEDNDPSEDYKRPFKIADAKLWPTTERNKFERLTMQHGYYQWEKMADTQFSRRSADDLKICSRALLLRCLHVSPTAEKDVVHDVIRAISVFYPVDPKDMELTEDERVAKLIADQDPQLLEIEDKDLPWVGAGDKERVEYWSFMKEAPPEYLDTLTKKAKNLLIRVALMFNIRHRNKPSPSLHMPVIVGGSPAPWWGQDEDRDLLIGICRHGYQQYSQIWVDEDLGFPKKYKLLAEQFLSKEEKKDPSPTNSTATDLPASEVDNDVEMGDDEGNEDEDEDMNANTTRTEPVAVVEGGFHPPTPTELGVRIRRILAALNRYRISQIKGKEKDDMVNEKNRIRNEKRASKMKSRVNDLTKRHKHDFQRILLFFGVPNTDGKNDWTQFKILAELTVKADEVLDAYLSKLIELSKETLVYYEKEGKKIQEDGSLPTQDTLNDTSNPLYPNQDGETLTFDRAKKIVKRLSVFDKLRKALADIELLKSKMESTKRYGNSILPKWWTNEFDLPFMLGCAKYGLNRSDLFIEDEELPFKKVNEEYLASLEERKEKSLFGSTELCGNFEEKFWMRDSVALKRLELLVAIGDKPTKVKKAAKISVDTLQSIDKKPKAIGASDMSIASMNSSPQISKVSVSSSGEDTDALLQSATKRIKKRKKTKAIPEVKSIKIFEDNEEKIKIEMDKLKKEYVGELQLHPILIAPAGNGLKRVPVEHVNDNSKKLKLENGSVPSFNQ